MQIGGFHTKAEAIRSAAKESLEYNLSHTAEPNFKNWLGLGLIHKPHKARFKSEDDIWDSNDN